MKYLITNTGEVTTIADYLEVIPNENEILIISEEIFSFIKPMYNFDTQEFYEGVTADEIADYILQEKNKLIKETYEIYNNLYVSSLARAVNKVGQGLNSEQLFNLKQEYEDKKQVAEQFLNNGNADNQILLQEIAFQMEQDYPNELLNNRIDEINSAYSLNISKDGERLERYCRIVIAMYNLGNAIWNTLKPLCSTFRSSMLTSIDNNDIISYNLKKALALSITNDTSISDILLITNQFKTL